MTPKEIEAARKPLYRKPFSEMTEEERRRYHELSWREYINSCLAYGQLHQAITQDNRIAEMVYRYGTAKTYSIGERISEERAVEIARDQEKDFNDRVTVYYNTYTDHEGCTYNSVSWNEE